METYTIYCKNECGRVLGESSVPDKKDHLCLACFQEADLEMALRNNQLAEHDAVPDEKIKEIVTRVAEENPEQFFNSSFGPRIDYHAKKHAKVKVIFDEEDRKGIEAATERERTLEKAPEGNFKFLK